MTHASVFSGIGGPEVAAAMLGWDNLFHCEINPFGRAVLQYWFPNSKSYEDITTTDFSEWGGRVNVLTGGFPCQPFSYAGQRRGADDDRYLWPFMHRCINQVRPDWVVCENVAGILTMVEQGDVTEMAAEKSLFDEGDTLYRYRLDETFTLERICNDLERDGYAVQAVIIPACAVNAPHRRDRVFIIGCRNNIAHPDLHRGCEMDEHLEPQFADGSKPVGIGRERIVVHSSQQCGQRDGLEQSGTGRAQQEQLGGRNCQDGSERTATHTNGNLLQETWARKWAAMPLRDNLRDGKRNEKHEGGEGIAGCGRWDTFPTVSPVHRGNDGIPFPLDDLTLSPSKWRTESLKAYGNAIVPQVMYEIFRAIEETYQ